MRTGLSALLIMQQAIITGGEGGLGEAISTTLKSAGVDVLSPGRGDLNVADAASVKDYFHQSDDIDLRLVQCRAGIAD